MTAATHATWGWYLYGITRHAPLDIPLEQAGASLHVLDCSGVAAVVRPVVLADFTPAVLQERLRSPSELATIVRSHNRVIEAIHTRQAILPAKFGSVYAEAEDIVTALQSERATLLPQLDGVEGRDEWAVHVYADGAVVRDGIANQDLAIARLRKERAAARPGRAYLLEQQIGQAVEQATERRLETLAQSAFDRLSSVAFRAQLTQGGIPAAPADDAGDEIEILRAAFLVSRECAERFKLAVRSCQEDESMRSEYSGPWPPYSFAGATR